MTQQRTIYVDLDGTLVRTDLLWEAIVAYLTRSPLNIFALVGWLLRGRSKAKTAIARQVGLDASLLPYETELIDYLGERKQAGDKLVLATASHWVFARAVAAHLGIFDDVIATTSRRNLKGEEKLAAIREHVRGGEFAYAGDSPADRPIWQAAAASILVNASASDIAREREAGRLEKSISPTVSPLSAFVRNMRVHQWAKNILVFVPLLTSHTYIDAAAGLDALLAFLALSLCASGVYMLNDLLDLDAGRRHASKRKRPMACGELPVQFGLLGAMALPAVAIVMAALLLPVPFLITLVVYYCISNLYSFALKRHSTIDVITLAVLFTVRIVAGAAAIDVELSSWLVAFSMFLFVSLAYLKRYIEVAAIERDEDRAHGRGYSAADRETMFGLGIANSTAAVLVLALYISSPGEVERYAHPEFLWLICLLLLFWSNRIWVGARRGKIDDDPVVFAVKDKVSRRIGILMLLVVLAARYVPSW